MKQKVQKESHKQRKGEFHHHLLLWLLPLSLSLRKLTWANSRLFFLELIVSLVKVFTKDTDWRLNKEIKVSGLQWRIILSHSSFCISSALWSITKAQQYSSLASFRQKSLPLSFSKYITPFHLKIQMRCIKIYCSCETFVALIFENWKANDLIDFWMAPLTSEPSVHSSKFPENSRRSLLY